MKKFIELLDVYMESLPDGEGLTETQIRHLKKYSEWLDEHFKDSYGWHNYVGERVLVKMSKYATEYADRIVTGYKDGFVEFDNDGNWYAQNSVIPYMVWKSEKYPDAWTW